MSVTIVLGWWLLPLALAVALFTWALWERPSDRGGFIPSPAPLIRLVGAVIISLLGLVVYLTVRLVLA